MSLNLPNALAFLRVFLAPLMFWLLLSANSFSSVHVDELLCRARLRDR